MIKIAYIIIKNFFNRKDPVMHLGRWSHPSYRKFDNTNLKIYLANSCENTGLCINKK